MRGAPEAVRGAGGSSAMERAGGAARPRWGAGPPAQGPRDGAGRARAGSGAGQGQGPAGSDGAAATGERSPGRAVAWSQGQRGGSHGLCLSSSSDEEFETFLARMKTPKVFPKKADASLKDFIDDSDDFFLDFKRERAQKRMHQRIFRPRGS
ncbi:translation initiation factor IF-2-like [Chiroxiphia lanceolata]|uniref:translation initiation factor IF-2-like n=1 Tax=Chiroxiphia lanceolata TaxID=296741 RepID=UPI0013CF08BB|nr:translation initiation factor IF-2-like [Chiroxiphia lanceolata]